MQVVNAKDLDVVMLIYNLINLMENSNNYAKTLR